MAASFPKSPFRSVWRWLWVILIFGCCLVVIYLLIGRRSVHGKITFKHATPMLSPVATMSRPPPAWLAKLYETFEKLKPKPTEILDTPKMTPELGKSVELWYQKLLLRYPELAVPMRNIPDADNGFLQLLNLMDRVETKNKQIPFPAEITAYLQDTGPWQTEVTQKWLAENSGLVADLHAIGRLAGRSVNRIPVERWFLIPAKLIRNFNEILILEARLAAEQGDVAAALEAVRTARSLMDHFSKIETPTLLIAVAIITQLNLAVHVLADIIPALPDGKVDPVAWENALNLAPADPAEFAQIVKGEWHVGIRCFLLPYLLNPNPSEPIPDSGELLDFYSLHTVEVCHTLQNVTLKDLATLEIPPIRDTSHLSARGREFNTRLVNINYLEKGWRAAQSVAAMTHAAFALMKGEPIPKDPILCLDYIWDATTRQLSFPPGLAEEIYISSLSVPKISLAEPNTPQP